MKFRIIWIDDSNQWVNSVKDSLNDAFVQFDFEPEVQYFTEINDEVRFAISSNYLDLLIIDCNLPGLNGNEFIVELRHARCFSHILFYSQDSGNLELISQDKHFTHVTPRDDFTDIIEVVAEQAYRKYNHPSFMRGLLLSEFIDLEGLLDDLISQCFKSEGGYFRDSIINKGGESFSLYTKQKFVSRLLNDKVIDDEVKKILVEIGFTSSSFQRYIIERRNVLAHAQPVYDADTQTIKLVSALPDVNFDAAWFYETRSYIHNFKDKIKKIYSLELFKYVNP